MRTELYRCFSPFFFVMMFVLLLPCASLATEQVETALSIEESDSLEVESLEGGGDAVWVTPPVLPTYVEVQLTLLRIARIDGPGERFPTTEIEAFLEADWIDHRLAFDPEKTGTEEEIFIGNDAEYELEQIWWPDIIIQNERHKREREDIELIIKPNGAVSYKERFFAIIPLDFDLHKFPFDSQQILIDLESFAWNDKSVIFKHGKHMTGLSDDLTLQEWEITHVGAELYDVHEARGEDGYSKLELQIMLTRHPWHYVKTIIIPLGIILFMLCTIVYCNLDKRIEFILIALLSLVAFHGIISDALPKLSSLIFLDVLILMGYLITMFALLESVIAQRMVASGNQGRAERMEQMNRKVFPYVFGLIICGGVLGYVI
ncbi:MAG: hypothetical protein KKB70_01325 [Proteobacteria bacterium]|nr:hypothetical protein [Pseudomonadota bacterium]